MTPQQHAPKPLPLPLRLYSLLKEPGEVATLIIATAAAIYGGKLGVKLFQGEGSLPAGIAQGVFTLAGLFVVYYFRDKMRKTDRQAEIHKTDTAAGLDFVKIVQDLTNNLNAANSERLKEQRNSYRATIGAYKLDLTHEREIKHEIGNVSNAAIMALTLVRERVKLGVCTVDELFAEEQDRPEYFRQKLDALRMVPRPALDALASRDDIRRDDIHTTP